MKTKLFWINFTAYNESGKALKVITRLCDSHQQVIKVALALQNKLKYEGLAVDFMGYDVADFHNTTYDDAMLSDIAGDMTHTQMLDVISLNPCQYARFNDIGLKGLQPFYNATNQPKG